MPGVPENHRHEVTTVLDLRLTVQVCTCGIKNVIASTTDSVMVVGNSVAMALQALGRLYPCLKDAVEEKKGDFGKN